MNFFATLILLEFAADMTYGMLASGSCLLMDVVDQLHETSKKVNSVERLTRHLNKGIPAPPDTFFQRKEFYIH